MSIFNALCQGINEFSMSEGTCFKYLHITAAPAFRNALPHHNRHCSGNTGMRTLGFTLVVASLLFVSSIDIFLE